jgi:hypothetical protein
MVVTLAILLLVYFPEVKVQKADNKTYGEMTLAESAIPIRPVNPRLQKSKYLLRFSSPGSTGSDKWTHVKKVYLLIGISDFLSDYR